MRIRTFSDPVLRRSAAPVKRVDEATRRLAARMILTMRANKGVGLAAPQVGISSRLIVVDIGQGPHVLVNPKVTAASGAATDWEGCLSLPGLVAEVERAERVSVEALGLDGKPTWLEAEGLLARALQHEIDHLDGVVILDRARSVEKTEPEETPEVEPAVTTAAGRGLEEGEAARGDVPEAARPLRVVFMGTPAFAVPTLEALVAAGHTIVGVVTRPDRPAGRGGRTVQVPPVKRVALAFGLPLWQGTGRQARESLAAVVRKWGAEAAVVVAYGVILPRDVLEAPRYGCFNLHASLLPDYRGAAPIQRAILDGRSLTGVTVIKMDEGVDTGGIIVQREVSIRDDDTAGTLHDRLAEAGAGLVLRALDLVASGRAAPRPQPAGPAAPAPPLGPADEVIDWTRSALDIARQVRALSPVPGAYTLFGGRRIKVWKVAVVPGPAAAAAPAGQDRPRPGEIVTLADGVPVVATGKGSLALRVLQPAGGLRMPAEDFVNGQRAKVGDRFGAVEPNPERGQDPAR